jgi:hypothetical protein
MMIARDRHLDRPGGHLRGQRARRGLRRRQARNPWPAAR